MGGDNVKGSYDFTGMVGQREELDRLRTQALTAWGLEKALLENAGLRDGMQALDIGCGPGFITCKIAQDILPGGRITGIEPDDCLRETAQINAKTAANVEIRSGNIYELDLPDNTLDFVYARLVFQHLARPQDAMRQILRVLKPGGILLVVDVDDAWMHIYPAPEEFGQLLENAQTKQSAYGGDRFIGRKLQHLMSQAGYNSATTTIQVLDSTALSMPVFLRITSCYKLLLTGDKAHPGDGEDVYQRICKFAEDNQSYGQIGVFVCRGVK